MRKISADYIFPISSPPIKNGVITIDDSGLIIDVDSGIENPTSDIEYYEGLICPGFINTHCHLELSHLRSQVSEKTGMTGFIKELISKRFDFSEEQRQKSIAEAEAEMLKNGIVAVGDISNNSSSFRQKGKGNLLYHTFIEIFDLNPDKADEAFKKGLTLQQELSQISQSASHCSIVPHAPYTMSENLLKMINDYAFKNKSILSIHNQESEAENELFISKSGLMYETFINMGIKNNLMKQTGVNSLKSTLPFFKNAFKLLLVHNTFTVKEDIEWANSQFSILDSQSLFWCTCPNANMFIENRLPDYNYFMGENAIVTIGTDSLASNRTLSVLDELKTIAEKFPQISLATLLLWATKNGADFLGFTQLGTIEKGKKPGLNLLKNIHELKISSSTEVHKLL